MDNHFDRTTAFSDESEFKGLYSWSLQEQDADGVKVGRDLVPWEWTLYFKANDIALQEQWGVGKDRRIHEELEKTEIKNRRFIHASLYPDDTNGRAPNYSMIGTNRQVTDFQLRIEELAEGQVAQCWSYGSVSYTADVDFRDETVDDFIIFSFYLPTETFEHYAERVVAGHITSLFLSLSGVQGFYSDWSPSISANTIKVLTSNTDHEVKSQKDGVTIPRLGAIKKGELYFNHVTKFAVSALELEDDDKDEEFASGERPVDRALQLERLRDRRSKETVKLLNSVRMAAWIIAATIVVGLFV